MFRLFFVVALVTFVTALPNGLAKTPQMGWNTWNLFACNIDDKLVRETVDIIKKLGLDKFGYNYVNLDDCWQVSRDANGYIVPDPKRFPNGMKSLADYVHSKGLLFGVYSDAGTNTCQGRPGSWTFEKKDAESYAAWGVDYLKYDNCNNLNIAPKVRYPPMRDALKAQNRSILFSMCEWGVDSPYLWASAVGNSWRTTGDISDNWNSMIGNVLQNDVGAAYAGPGAWNDPDMLEIGNGGMSTTEYQTHFTLWTLVKSPLLLGNDLRKMSREILGIITNREAIAINQDSLGIQGKLLKKEADSYHVWGGPLADGSWSLALVNLKNVTQTVEADFSLIGMGAFPLKVRDIWQQKDLGVVQTKISASLASHQSAYYRVKPTSLPPQAI